MTGRTGRAGWRAGLLASTTAAVVVAGVLVLAWAATSGPVAMLGATPVDRDPGRLPTESASTSASASGQMPSARQLTEGTKPSADLSWLGQLFGYTLLLGLCLLLFLALRAAWRSRWRRPDKPVAVDFEVTASSAAAAALAHDAEHHLEAVDRGLPRDGIVACWVRLEETVAGSGIAVRASETSTELVTRVLRSLDVDPRAVARLAALYREARFSDHPLGEDSRHAAREALRRLHHDLSVVAR